MLNWLRLDLAQNSLKAELDKPAGLEADSIFNVPLSLNGLDRHVGGISYEDTRT
ncbi:MAG: hypothetical protein AB1589_09820 [Cyanobacteriota bacterium]